MTHERAEQLLVGYVISGDHVSALGLFRQFVSDRVGAMHLRAQSAESRAHKAERNLERITLSSASQ
jgi:hypothetical protein